MDIQFTTQILKEGDTFVAYAPELDVSSCGKTIQEAKVHLAEAVTLFIEEAERMGTLQDILEEAGFTKEAAGWKAPEIVVQEKNTASSNALTCRKSRPFLIRLSSEHLRRTGSSFSERAVTISSTQSPAFQDL